MKNLYEITGSIADINNMTYKIKDNEVVVSREIYWLPIDENTPRSVKVLAINRAKCGVAQFAELHHSETWYDYWSPLPKFKDSL